jgi:hypothetical protein
MLSRVPMLTRTISGGAALKATHSDEISHATAGMDSTNTAAKFSRCCMQSSMMSIRAGGLDAG